MARASDAAQRIFLRYAVTNILVLPVLTAAIYYRMSIRVIRQNVDAVSTSQLERSMIGIERLFTDMRNMSIRLSNDDEINFYLNNQGAFTGIELYNMKRISEKLFSCEGYTASWWREEILHTTGGETFLPLLKVSMGGQQSTSHIYRRSIRYGGCYLGSIIGVVDEGSLDRMLGGLPRKYGGWAYIQDSAGRLIATTSPDAGALPLLEGAPAPDGMGHLRDDLARDARLVPNRYSLDGDAHLIDSGGRECRREPEQEDHGNPNAALLLALLFHPTLRLQAWAVAAFVPASEALVGICVQLAWLGLGLLLLRLVWRAGIRVYSAVGA